MSFASQILSSRRFMFLAAGALAIAAALAPFALAQQKSFVIPTQLSKSLDSKKAQAGEPVEAKVSAPFKLPDGTQIPKGAKVIGHVVASKARSKGDSESSLQVVFDKVDLADGKTLNISAFPQAVGANPSSGQSGDGVGYSGLRQTVEHSQPGDQSQPITILDAQSTGAHGINHLQLTPEGLFTSDGKAVKVDYGSQLILQAKLAN